MEKTMNKQVHITKTKTDATLKVNNRKRSS